MNYLFVDTETTGKVDFRRLDDLAAQPHIVQLAFELCGEDGIVRASGVYLIYPNRWTIPKEAEAIHGISTEMCKSYGIAMRDGLDILEELSITPYFATSILPVAHSFDFDRAMVDTEAARLNRILDAFAPKARSFCTMKAMTPICKLPAPAFRGVNEYKWPKLEEAYKFLFPTRAITGIHDAGVDVRMCREIFFEARKRGYISVGQ